MYPPRRLALAAAAILGLTVAACAPIRVNSFVHRDARFTDYRTYDFAASETFATGDPRLDNNPFFQERVRAEVAAELDRRGFERATGGTADLVLHYHANVNQEVEPNGVDRQYGYCRTCEPYVYDAGTLVIDFVDRRTNRMVWRGWAEGSIEGAIDNQAFMERRVADAVARIMARFPRS
jgi:hypothetical protein